VLADADPFAPGPDARFAVSVRLCDADGRQPRAGEEQDARFRPWHEAVPPDGFGGRTVVFGHWAVQGLVVRPGLRGLDSGCVWGGRLSAWIAEEDRVASVPAERAWAQVS
jgi:bis(5'-nucleosyl)-tetraphosphatase (symmetrical)